MYLKVIQLSKVYYFKYVTGDVVDRAVLAAKNAFPAWSSLSIPSRAEYLIKAANKVEQRLEEFAIAEARDQGKPLSLALKIDIPRVLTNLRAFAEGHKHLLETSNSMVGVRIFIHYILAISNISFEFYLAFYESIWKPGG